jgi:short-subunit dehydrogenase
VNSLHPIYLGKVCAEKMMKQDHKSGLIVTSSISGHYSSSGNATYSSTKAFVSNFFQSVYFEMQDKVDVLVW